MPGVFLARMDGRAAFNAAWGVLLWLCIAAGAGYGAYATSGFIETLFVLISAFAGTVLFYTITASIIVWVVLPRAFRAVNTTGREGGFWSTQLGRAMLALCPKAEDDWPVWMRRPAGRYWAEPNLALIDFAPDASANETFERVASDIGDEQVPIEFPAWLKLRSDPDASLLVMIGDVQIGQLSGLAVGPALRAVRRASRRQTAVWLHGYLWKRGGAFRAELLP